MYLRSIPCEGFNRQQILVPYYLWSKPMNHAPHFHSASCLLSRHTARFHSQFYPSGRCGTLVKINWPLSLHAIDILPKDLDF